MVPDSDLDLPGRRRRVTIAGHSGDPTTARSGLSDSDPGIRAAALSALARLGTLERDELAEAMRDVSSLVRSRAATLAARRDDVTTELARLLNDNDDSVVEVAAFAIGEHAVADSSTVKSLVEIATGHQDSLCRESAVSALGAIGDPQGLDAILDACSDKAPVRRRAALALAAFDAPEATSKLQELLGDRDLQVRQIAEELLAIEMGEEL